MSNGIRRTALMALAMWGLASAGGTKSSDTNASKGSTAGSAGGQAETGAVSSASAGQGSSGNGSGSAQGGTTSTSNSDGNGQGLQRKQARAARHADIDKARQQVLDSVETAFAEREGAEIAGTSELISLKNQDSKKAKEK
jgi:hypothetical protein